MDKNNATENQLLMAMAYGKAMRSRDDDEHEALLEYS